MNNPKKITINCPSCDGTGEQYNGAPSVETAIVCEHCEGACKITKTLTMSARFKTITSALNLSTSELQVMWLARFGTVKNLKPEQFTSWVLDLEYQADNLEVAA